MVYFYAAVRIQILEFVTNSRVYFGMYYIFPVFVVSDLTLRSRGSSKYYLRIQSGRLGGVVISVLATGPKGCGFITRPRRWIFKGDKNPQHIFLSDGK
jgi:hypothetical protein